MNLISGLVGTSLGRKLLMAVTGFGLFAFVVVHMAGNLQFFLGREVINRYAHLLKANPEFLWPARIGLLLCVGIHLWMAVLLTLENRTKRLRGYAVKEVVGTTLASRTMIWSGLIIACFVGYHLLHYTVLVQSVNLTGHDFHLLTDTQGRPDVYEMMVIGFSNTAVTVFYLFGVGLLCFHLSHGVRAMLQSLGLVNGVYRTAIERFSTFSAVLLFAGYVSVPLAVWIGLVP